MLPSVRTPQAIAMSSSRDRKSTRLNSSHSQISYAVFCLNKKGNLYITSGNGFHSTYDNGNAVFKLSPALALVDWWVPSEWPYMNATDADLGSIDPAIVGATNDVVFQTGKTGWGYLLGTTLSPGGVHFGGEPVSGQVCNGANNATNTD